MQIAPAHAKIKYCINKIKQSASEKILPFEKKPRTLFLEKGPSNRGGTFFCGGVFWFLVFNNAMSYPPYGNYMRSVRVENYGLSA